MWTVTMAVCRYVGDRNATGYVKIFVTFHETVLTHVQIVIIMLSIVLVTVIQFPLAALETVSRLSEVPSPLRSVALLLSDCW